MNLSSDDSVNANNTLHKNVQVKIEPGTSSLSSDSGVLKNIKMEPGLPTTAQRLTSYRLPRDLTLGGNVKTEKSKKIYMPNLNAQRNRKKDEPVTSKVEIIKSKDSGSRDRGRGRDRGRSRGNLIQSMGVWSEGINAPATARRYTGSSGNSGTSTRKYLEKPKLNLNKVVNKEEEKEKLKNLIGDDDDEDPNEKADYIMLPMNEHYYRKLYKKEFRVNINPYSDENDVDRKPIISENGEVITVKNEQKVNMEILKEEKKEPSQQFFDMIENKSNSYILLQLPTLPGLRSEDEKPKEEPKSKRPNDSRLTTNTNNIENSACSLNELNSGLLGKLEILRSGKARLRLGENYLDVTTGTHFSALQHVVAVKMDNMSLTGDLVNLGPVTDSLVCSVDVDYLTK